MILTSVFLVLFADGFRLFIRLHTPSSRAQCDVYANTHLDGTSRLTRMNILGVLMFVHNMTVLAVHQTHPDVMTAPAARITCVVLGRSTENVVVTPRASRSWAGSYILQ